MSVLRRRQQMINSHRSECAFCCCESEWGKQPVNSSLLTQDHLFKWTPSSADELGRERDREEERKGAVDESSAEELLVLTVSVKLGRQKYGRLNSDEAYHRVYMFYISTFFLAAEYITSSSTTCCSCAASTLRSRGASGLGGWDGGVRVRDDSSVSCLSNCPS